MESLKLIQYLKANLRFGCIKHSLFEERLTDDDKMVLVVTLLPFSAFFDNDQHFIRCNVLESMEVRSMPFVKVRNIDLSPARIVVVYSFS